jgi:hypothetical protein
VHRDYSQPSRVWTYYRLTKWAPWPTNIREAISAEETRRRADRKPKSSHGT